MGKECQMVLHYLLDNKSNMVFSQIIIKDMSLLGVILNRWKCGVFGLFEYRHCNSKFVLLIKR